MGIANAYGIISPYAILFKYARFMNTIIAHTGALNPRRIAQLSEEISGKLQRYYPQAERKLHSIFIELAQNIMHYSVQSGSSVMNRYPSCITITEMNGGFRLEAANLIYAPVSDFLQDRCTYINSLSERGLRKYRLSILERGAHGLPDNSRGAGIGLIQVAITSGNQLGYRIEKVNSQFKFYKILVKVNK